MHVIYFILQWCIHLCTSLLHLPDCCIRVVIISSNNSVSSILLLIICYGVQSYTLRLWNLFLSLWEVEEPSNKNYIVYSCIMSVVGQYLSVLVNYRFLGIIKYDMWVPKVCPKFHLYLHTHACMHELYYTIYYAHWDCMHCRYIMYTVIILTHIGYYESDFVFS